MNFGNEALFHTSCDSNLLLTLRKTCEVLTTLKHEASTEKVMPEQTAVPVDVKALNEE
jgi:hypothetical protein